ncbi:MAG TPA: DnaA/Hda family protein [Caulifigura sp.]|nr:DnaA/Hda family protein [Caulifigura sp.]
MRSAARDDHSFLVLRENRLAFAAASRLVAASKSKEAPPPVTIYGPSGTGKSHLVRQAVRTYRAHSPGERVVALSAAQFGDEFAEASDSKSLAAFVRKYRVPTGLFVCEDLQALDGREQTQVQFVSLWNDLANRQTRMLFTMDRSPGELRNVSPRLVNRLQGGICISTGRYGSESREKLVGHFAQQLQLPLTTSQTRRIAESPRNGHELLGLLSSLRLRLKAKPGEGLAVAIDGLLGTEPAERGVTLNEIGKAVAAVFGVKLPELRSESRDRRLATPRQVAMHVMRELGGAQLGEIGDYFGGRTHSTVLHSCRRIAREIEDDETLRLQFDQVCRRLRRKGSAA